MLNMQVPFDDMVKILKEITTAIDPLMNAKQEEHNVVYESDNYNKTVIENNSETVIKIEKDK